jgi:uncharacterized protein (TIGR03437 family)
MGSTSWPLTIVIFAGLNFAQAFGQTYTISTYAGTSFNGGVPGTSANLAVPSGVASDPAGNLYFTNQNQVLRLDSETGIVSVFAGNGTPGYSGDHGPATDAQISVPLGIALDAAGLVYIASPGCACVRAVFNGVITTVAGNGTPGFSGDGGPATAAQLSSPEGLVVDSSGSLYIGDTSNNRIRKVAGGVMTTFAGNGSTTVSGDGGPAISAGVPYPVGLALDGAGNLYVSGLTVNRVRRIVNGVIGTFAGTGAEGFSGDGGPASAATLSEVAGLATDSSGILYIADEGNSRVRKVTNGIITTVAGNGTFGYNGDNIPPLRAELFDPDWLATDSAGSLYIADSVNGRIRMVSDGVIRTVAGAGTSASRGDNGPAVSAYLNGPAGLAVDSAGNLYLADSNDNRIRKIANGAIATVAGNGLFGLTGDGGSATGAELYSASAIAVDSAGALYLSQVATVRKISQGTIATVAGNGTLGFSGDNGPATSAALYWTFGVAVDSAGNLYIAEEANCRVRKVSNGVITTVAGNGVCGFAGDGGPAISAELSGPYSVALDSAGNLYIADLGNSRIRKVSNGLIATIAGNGTPGFGGDGGPATSAEIYAPTAIAVDAPGNLYIADSSSFRIRKVSGGIITTIAGIGVYGFSGDGGPATSAAIGAPEGIAVDAAGDVYFSEAGNNRVRKLTPSVLVGATPSLAGSPVNAADFAAGGALVPGSLATVYGNFLLTSPSIPSGVPTSASLTGLSLEFAGGLTAPLLYAGPSQVNFQVPWELAGQAQSTVAVAWNGQAGAAKPVGIAAFAPGIFAMNGQGTGQGAILDSSYALVDASNPATAGASVIQIYCTGLGAVDNQPVTGAPAPETSLSHAATTPTVLIGGAQATVMFSGLAPGSVGGYQINATVPAGSAKGAAVPVVVSIGGATSNTVTLAVR